MTAPIDLVIQNLNDLADRLTLLKITKSSKEAATLQQWLKSGGVTSIQQSLETYLQSIRQKETPTQKPSGSSPKSPRTPLAPSPIHTPKAFTRTPLAPSPTHTPKALMRTPLAPSPIHTPKAFTQLSSSPSF